MNVKSVTKGKKHSISIFYSISMLLVFLLNLNLMKKEKWIAIVLFAFIFMFCADKTIMIGKAKLLIYIFAFCFFYTMIMVLNDYLSLYTSVLTYTILPIISFLSGYFILDGKTDYGKRFMGYMMAAIMGRTVHAVINMVMHIRTGGGGRNPLDYWTGLPLAATGQSALFTAILSLLFFCCFILTFRKHPVYKTVLLGLIIFAIVSSIIIGARTSIVICIIVNILCVLFQKPLKFGMDKKQMRIYIITFISIIALFVIYDKNYFGVKTMFQQSILFERLQESQSDVRLERQLIVIQNLFNYPFGKMNVYGYAHSLWLDTARTTGIIPLLLIIMLTVSVIAEIKKYIGNTNNRIDNRAVLFSVIIATTLNFCVEPILEGMPYYFFMVLFITGLVVKSNQLNKLRESEKLS